MMTIPDGMAIAELMINDHLIGSIDWTPFDVVVFVSIVTLVVGIIVVVVVVDVAGSSVLVGR